MIRRLAQLIVRVLLFLNTPIGDLIPHRCAHCLRWIKPGQLTVRHHGRRVHREHYSRYGDITTLNGRAA